MTAAAPQIPRSSTAPHAGIFGGGAMLFAMLIWSYWPVLVPLWGDWRRDPNYSVGMLVPLAAVWLIWHVRHRLAATRCNPSPWGFAVLAVAILLRLAGQLLMFESLERYSLVAMIAGLIVLIGSGAAMRVVAGPVALLLLMVPLPGRVHNAISPPLQQAAAALATYSLELAGFSVLREGYSLTVSNRATVNITEGCSGLRLLTAFVMVAAVFAMLVRRPNPQRWLLVLSALPIAILCNVLRIVATAILCAFVSSRAAEVFFHDFAGVSMMPVAVLMLWGLLRLFDWLTENPAKQQQGAAQA